MSCDRIKQLSHQTYGRRILTFFEKTNEHERIEMDTTNHFELFHSFIKQIITKHLPVLDIVLGSVGFAVNKD